MICSLCQRTFDGRQRRFVVESSQRATWGRIRPGIFCSKRCQARWRSGLVPLQCAVCYVFLGKITKWRPLNSRHSVVCSKSCSAILRLQAQPFSQEDWKRLNRSTTRRDVSEAIRERDQNTCQICGTRRSRDKILSADHIVPLLLAKEHDPVNLITLCEARCHRRKTKIESFLFEGDLVTFLTCLEKAGWPMQKVRMAMKRYGLPTTVSEIRRPARPKSLFLATRPSPIC